MADATARTSALSAAVQLAPLNDLPLVLRHSGRDDGRWRLLLAAHIDRAIARFERESERLRQGAIALIHDGQILRFGWAPRLRTRW